jgi:hypothetical protein
MFIFFRGVGLNHQLDNEVTIVPTGEKTLPLVPSLVSQQVFPFETVHVTKLFLSIGWSQSPFGEMLGIYLPSGYD